MPEYVYGCEDRHQRTMIHHGFHEDPEITCMVCGKRMHRIPQPFRFYRDPNLVLLDYMDDKFRETLAKKEKRKNDNKRRAN